MRDSCFASFSHNAQDFSTVPADYGWDYDLGLAEFVKVTNPFDKNDILRYPRSMVIDYDDRYLYVASYSNSRVIAFIRDSSTGMLFYKTSVQNKANYLSSSRTDTESNLFFPIDLALSGDGG